MPSSTTASSPRAHERRDRPCGASGRRIGFPQAEAPRSTSQSAEAIVIALHPPGVRAAALVRALAGAGYRLGLVGIYTTPE